MELSNTQAKNPQIFVCKLATKLKSVVYPKERQQEIDACKSHQVKLEKYTAWQLLRYAVEKVCQIPFEMLCLCKNDNGKWVSENLYFSISHSNDLCAVALDVNPIGIDLQLSDEDRFDIPLLNRIATDKEWDFLAEQIIAPAEKEGLAATRKIESWQILSLWCKKEALFKKLDCKNFVPKQLDTTTVKFVESNLETNNLYHVAVATDAKKVDFHLVEIE